MLCRAVLGSGKAAAYILMFSGDTIVRGDGNVW
jgi:hypothetical protein